jgi:hypothetical protein
MCSVTQATWHSFFKLLPSRASAKKFAFKIVQPYIQQKQQKSRRQAYSTQAASNIQTSHHCHATHLTILIGLSFFMIAKLPPNLVFFIPEKKKLKKVFQIKRHRLQVTNMLPRFGKPERVQKSVQKAVEL